MRCEEIMTKDPTCCALSDTAFRAAKLMAMGDIGAVPVCEDSYGRKLLGIVTDRDLVMKVISEGRDPHTTSIREIMTREPLSCVGGDDIEMAFDAMSLFQVRRIPIVDEGGRLIGIISQGDLATRSSQPQKAAQVLVHVSTPAMRAA
jgi:CBS domain-containing protein